MENYKMQQDYSTRQQRKSPRTQSNAKVKRLPSKLKQAIFWMILGLVGGLLVNYFSNSSSEAVKIAGKQAPTKQQVNKKDAKPQEDKRVIQLELPTAG
tara:strand:- start:65788 stop:66081 length:294 start_codon:yes stop_codon:yes gene_type:complete